MFDDYKKEVLDCYLKKKNEGILPFNLIELAPAKIKDEAIVIYQERANDADDEILRSYLNAAKNPSGYLKVLEQIDKDKFKPIQRFVNGITKNPNRIVVELLAWLIDYNPRPYQIWVEKKKRAKTKDIPEETSRKKRKLTLSIKITLTFLVLLAFGASILTYYNRIESRTIDQNENCMFWNKYRFEAVDCGKEIDAEKIPLDVKRLKSLKRITKPDTLTKNSIGKVWYAKINGKPEFYTADGFHPTQPHKKLHPLTQYMLNKYVSYDRYLLLQIINIFVIMLILATLAFGSVRYFKKHH